MRVRVFAFRPDTLKMAKGLRIAVFALVASASHAFMVRDSALLPSFHCSSVPAFVSSAVVSTPRSALNTCRDVDSNGHYGVG